MPFFSVITINLNNKGGLQRTMQSVFNQNFRDFQYIVVDGESIDGSVELIESHSSRIDKKLIGKDTGVYNAMNKGLSVADGDYIVFLNSGDEFRNREALNRIAEKCSDHDFVYCDVEVFHGTANRISRHPGELTTRFLLTGMICHQAIFAKKTLFERTGPFNERFKVYGDYEWLLRAVLKFDASHKHIGRPLVRYEEVGLSNTTDKAVQRAEKDLIHDLYFSRWLVRLYRSYRSLHDKMDHYLGR
jgi:glycosyltransferase involved in cell wall biosynthesis